MSKASKGHAQRAFRRGIAHVGRTPPPRDQQRKIASLLMQWASPEMLEIVQFLSDIRFSVVVSLKSKGENVLDD